METKRLYTLHHAGGQVDIEAISTRNAIEIFQATYGDDWFSCGPKEPVPRITLPAAEPGTINKPNYDRIMADERKWENDKRRQMTLDLTILSSNRPAKHSTQTK